jgi:hypothetical protein
MSGKGKVIGSILHTAPLPPMEEDTRVAVESERQSRTRPAMLVVCLKNGDELLLPYALFRRAFKRGGGRTWELVFDDCTVVLTGRGLGDRLRDLLRLQRLSILREGNEIEGELAEEDEMFIESIEIKAKEGA